MNDKMIKSKGPRIGRRGFLTIGAAVGVTALVSGWGISQTKLMWQINEFMALASLGGKAQQASSAAYAGTEARIDFGNHPQQYALVFAPTPGAPRRNSVMFFVHGGGWNMGNPTLYRFIGRYFAQMGFSTILSGYRLTPDFRFPNQLEDVSAGLRAGMNHLVKSDAPVKRMILGGHSAGAQLAALMTYDSSIMQAERPLFSGLLAMSGPLNFAFCQSGEIRNLLNAYIGHLPDQEVANPIAHANPGIPISVLCLHGEKDPLVDPENSKTFTNKLNQGSTPRAQLHVLPDTYHSDALNLFFEKTDHTRLLADWLEAVDKV